MNAVKPEPSTRGTAAGARLTLAAALAALLLVYQLPLATDSASSSFPTGSGSMLLEAEDPELEFTDPPFPDLLFEASQQPQQGRDFGVATRSFLGADEAHDSFADIRAPPRLS